jgi:hypothetical protein
MRNGTRNTFLAIQPSAEYFFPSIALATAPPPNPFDTKKRALLHPEFCGADSGGVSDVRVRGGRFPFVRRHISLHNPSRERLSMNLDVLLPGERRKTR